MEKRNLVEPGRTPQFDKQAGDEQFDKQAKELFKPAVADPARRQEQANKSADKEG